MQIKIDTPSRPRLRVLISAYFCRPYVGSESGVGWNCVKALAKHHDLWVITRGDERSGIESIPSEEALPNVHFHYFELPAFLRLFGFGSRKRSSQLYYYIWQICIYFIARRLHAQHDFHVAHHVTLVKYWAPSLLAFLPIPFLWGPVGGGESAPDGFQGGFSWQGKLYETLRNIGRWIGEHDPIVRWTARRSAIILATSRETADRIRTLATENELLIQPAIAVTDEELLQFERVAAERRPELDNATLRFVSIGRLLHWKGFHLGVKAFARANIAESEYWIIGDGPEQAQLEMLAGRLGLNDRIRFLGRLSHAETLKALGECTCLVHPSLHESGGGVCLEAMAAKCPVIALDLGGPAEHHANGAGLLVSAEDPDRTVGELAGAMRRIATDPALRNEIADNAYARIQANYRWDKKAEYYANIYAELMRTHCRQRDGRCGPATPTNERHATNAE